MQNYLNFFQILKICVKLCEFFQMQAGSKVENKIKYWTANKAFLVSTSVFYLLFCENNIIVIVIILIKLFDHYKISITQMNISTKES